MDSLTRTLRRGALPLALAVAPAVPADAQQLQLDVDLVVTDAVATNRADDLDASDLAELERFESDAPGTALRAGFVFERSLFDAIPAAGAATLAPVETPFTLAEAGAFSLVSPGAEAVSNVSPGTFGRFALVNDLSDGGGTFDVVGFLLNRPYAGPSPDTAEDFYELLFFGASDWFETEADLAVSFAESVNGTGPSRILGVGFEGRTVIRSDAASGETLLYDEEFEASPVGGALAVRGGSEAAPLLPDAPTENGVSTFVIDETDVDFGSVVWIDPEIATGYDYAVTGGLVEGVVAPSFATVPDTDGYELLIGEERFALGVGEALDFATLGFGAGVSAFSVAGIDAALGLDPDDPLAFAVGRDFVEGSVGAGGVGVTQTARTETVGEVPLPAAGWLLVAGLGGLGWRARARAGARG